MQCLADGGIDGLGVQSQHGAEAGRDRRAEVCDVVDLVLVQADSADQVHLDFVGSGDAADQVAAADVELLGHRDQCRNVVTGM